MSGRSLRDTALVLAAHGDRGGEAPNGLLLAHRDRLHAAGVFLGVTAGVIKGEPSLEEALTAASGTGATRLAVFPMFMADGYFTRTVLPERIAALGIAVPCTLLPPLGLQPELPDLMLTDALATADRSGIDPGGARLLVVGHGSKLGPASADATRAVAEAIGRSAPFQRVETAFLEEPQFLADALGGAPVPTVISGFFSGEGMHAAEDVPRAMAQSGCPAVYAGPIGASQALAGLILDAVLRHTGLVAPEEPRRN